MQSFKLSIKKQSFKLSIKKKTLLQYLEWQ